MRILGIDPGIDRLGWAIVDHEYSRDTWVASGCIVTNRAEATATRLQAISKEITQLIQTHRPKHLGIEKLFFSKNSKTAMIVSEARGVVLSVAAGENLDITEVTPNAVKLSTTGSGAADKKQVARMIPLLIKLPIAKRLDDELDAIAVALTVAKLTSAQVRSKRVSQ